MFKYFSEILAQFSKPKKIVALLLLAVTIIIITITPSVIDAVYDDSDDLIVLIDQQKEEINVLRSSIDELNLIIRENQIECTNRILQREQEIINYINEIQKQFMIDQEPTLEKSGTFNDDIILDEPDPIDEVFNSFDELKEKIENGE